MANDNKNKNPLADVNAIGVIRIRGSIKVNKNIKYTLSLMNLHKQNHCTILKASSSVLGMLQKTKDYITFGPISEKMIENMLNKRGFVEGNNPITDEHVRHATVYSDIKDLSKALYKGSIKLNEIEKLKPVFRLHPPKGGFKGSTKKAYKAGGVLGNVGENFDAFLKKMI